MKPRTAQQRITGRMAQIPLAYRKTYQRAMSGKSRPAGVKAFCQMCMGWETVADNVRHCTDPACPLYPYRPYRQDAISAHFDGAESTISAGVAQ